MNDEDVVAPRDCRPPGTAVIPAVIVGPGGPAIDAGHKTEENLVSLERQFWLGDSRPRNSLYS